MCHCCFSLYHREKNVASIDSIAPNFQRERFERHLEVNRKAKTERLLERLPSTFRRYHREILRTFLQHFVTTTIDAIICRHILLALNSKQKSQTLAIGALRKKCKLKVPKSEFTNFHNTACRKLKYNINLTVNINTKCE